MWNEVRAGTQQMGRSALCCRLTPFAKSDQRLRLTAVMNQKHSSLSRCVCVQRLPQLEHKRHVRVVSQPKEEVRDLMVNEDSRTPRYVTCWVCWQLGVQQHQDSHR